MTPPPPNSIVTVGEPARIVGGVPLGYYATWATGEPLTIEGPPGVYPVRMFKPPTTYTKPVREESVSLVAIAQPVSPLEQAIAAQREEVRRCWDALTAANTRLLELEAAHNAGETEVPE